MTNLHLTKRIFLALLLCITTTSIFAAPKDSLRITIFGDSYSTFQGYLTPDTNNIYYFRADSPRRTKKNDVTSVEQTWWYQVIERLGAKLERNNSYSGSTVGYTGYKNREGKHQDYSHNAFVTRSNYLGEPDLILICAATNDSWAGAEVGKYLYGNQTRQDLFTFRPAMAKMLGDIRQNYPKAKVVFILNDVLRQDINESVHTICKHYDVPCLDLHDIDKQDGHPSIKGMKTFADQVVEFLYKEKIVKK